VTPTSYWIWFHLALVALLAVEYGLHKIFPDAHRKAVYATILWVLAAFALAGALVPRFGGQGSVQYLAGYAIEEALSIDNLFVFLLLFRLFRIPDARQPKVLVWGVAGAIVMRGAFIAAGVKLLQMFAWIDYVFGIILLIAAIRLMIPEKESKSEGAPGWIRWLSKLSPISDRQDYFFVRENGRWMATVLFLALVAVELTDVVFALDSIPAVLSITREPFLAYSSNIMAVMGLRSLYVLLAVMLAKLKFLHFGLAAVLTFAALKMLATKWIEVGPLASLAVIAVLLGTTVAASLLAARRTPATN
jgi:tellurite resistance protein TerC